MMLTVGKARQAMIHSYWQEARYPGEDNYRDHLSLASRAWPQAATHGTPSTR